VARDDSAVAWACGSSDGDRDWAWRGLGEPAVNWAHGCGGVAVGAAASIELWSLESTAELEVSVVMILRRSEAMAGLICCFDWRRRRREKTAVV
jgi:hypothetical protein